MDNLSVIFTVVVIVIGVVAAVISQSRTKAKREEQLRQSKKALRDLGFQNSHKFISPNYIVGINEKLQKIVYIDLWYPDKYTVCDFDKIVSAEIIENDQSVIKTNMGSALVWGNYASRRVEKKITKRGIRLIVDDLSNPMIYISCMRTPASEMDKLYAAFVAIGERVKNNKSST